MKNGHAFGLNIHNLEYDYYNTCKIISLNMTDPKHVCFCCRFMIQILKCIVTFIKLLFIDMIFVCMYVYTIHFVRCTYMELQTN